MRRLGLSLLAIALLALLACGLYFVPAVQDAVFERVAMQNATQRTDLLAPDALRVAVCGSAGPLPHPGRADTCVAVFAGGRWFLVDTGPGAWSTLSRWRVPGGALAAVFVTHLHSDHIGDLGEVNMQTWIAGRRAPLPVYGPKGITDLTHGFNVAYTQDRAFRTAHHGPAIANPRTAALAAIEVPLTNEIPEALVYDAGGVRVLAFRVDHAPAAPAFGYRFEFGGRSVVLSGDTTPNPMLAKVARNADLLLHEAIATHMLPTLAAAATASGRPEAAKILADIPGYHTTPVQAARIANTAKVRALVLYHLVPAPRNDLMRRIFMRGVGDVRPGVVAAEDGTLITLPVRSQAVQFGAM